jgi:hypothetical protein
MSVLTKTNMGSSKCKLDLDGEPTWFAVGSEQNIGNTVILEDSISMLEHNKPDCCSFAVCCSDWS